MVVGLLALAWSGVGCVNNVVLRQRGEKALVQKDYPAAAAHFEAATSKKPTDWESQLYLGQTLLALDRPLEAQLALEKALTLKPESPEVTPRIVDALAESLYRQQRFEALHTFLDEAVAYWGTTDDLLRQGKYLALTGDLDGAVVAYRKAGLWAQPTDPRPYLALADLYESLGDVPNTIIQLRQAYWAQPANPQLPDRFRKYGLVPGPTLALKPEKAPQPRRGLVVFPRIPGVSPTPLSTAQ